MFDDLDKLIHTDPFAKTTSHPALHLKEGERREVCILFADCHGFTALSERLDHEVVHTLLDKLMQLFTSRIKHFGGFIDKYEGDLVMALFGAKIATEQDTERAIEAGLQMLAVLEQFNEAVSKRLGQTVDIAVRIGINTGEVTTGRVGEKREGDFTVYGDAVNLASRMESNAPLNRVMMPRTTMQRVVHAFDFEPQGYIQVKGKTEPIDVWLVSSSKEERLSRWQVRWTAFVGREEEMARLQQKYEQVMTRLESSATASLLSTTSTEKPIALGLKGEAGMGKSRLVDEFLKQVGATSFYLHGTTPRLVQQAYGLFVTMIRKRFGISLLDSLEVSREKLVQGLSELSKFLDDIERRSLLLESLPLIGNLLGLPFEDVRLSLAPKDLQPHIQTAIRNVIEAEAARANRLGEALVVVLEDIHWSDAPSLAMLEFLFFTLNLEERRNGSDLRQVLFLLTYRPEYRPSRGILTDSEYEEVELSSLTPNLVRSLVESIVGQAPRLVSEETLALVMERSAGNPFFIEEWASYIAESPDVAGRASLPVPANLQALILARMDQLEAELKLLLQKAAVFGREFFVEIVEEMELRLDGKRDLVEYFSTLEKNQFLQSLPERSLNAYIFKHILTQEVAYATLLIANRKVLHRIAGEVLEDLFADKLEEHWRALAEHYEKGEVWEKAAEYLLKAADQAKEKYDNQVALNFYNRFLLLFESHPEVVEPTSAVKVMLGMGNVQELIGNWTDAARLYEKALEVSAPLQDKTLISQAQNLLGGIRSLQGFNDQAMECCQNAHSIAEKLNDKKGIFYSISNIGKLFFNLGDYHRAFECYQRSLSIAEELGDKRGISIAVGNMGNVFHNRGDYDRAFECHQRNLSIAEELGDKRGKYSAFGNLGIIFTERGDFDRALDCFQKGLTIAEELGDKHGISKAVGNVGNLFYLRYDYFSALECFQKNLCMAEELNDKQGIFKVAGNMGNVYNMLGDYDRALECHQKNLSIAEEIGDKRGISFAHGNMGSVFAESGNYDRALECYQMSLSIAKELGDKLLISYALSCIGRIYFEIGNYQYAEELLERAAGLSRELDVKPMLLQVLRTQSRLALIQNQLQRARDYCHEALTLAQEINNTDFMYILQILLEKINFLAAEDDSTRASSAAALTTLLEQTDDDEIKAELHYELAAIYLTGAETHPHDGARLHHLNALRLYESLYSKIPKFEYKKRIEELTQFIER